MSNIRAFLILVTATLSFALASPASADAGPGKCTGQFVNPITDICWSCLFPISVGGLEIWPSNLSVVRTFGTTRGVD